MFMTTAEGGKGAREKVVREEGGREMMVRWEGGGEKVRLFQYGKLRSTCETQTPSVAGQRANSLCVRRL